MRQLIDQSELRMAGEQRIEIEVIERLTAVIEVLARENFKPGQQSLGLGTAMGFDQSDDDIDASLGAPGRFLQHGVGLAHARRGAKEDLQPPAVAATGLREQRFR